MRIADVADDLRQAFDQASGGSLRRLIAYCQGQGFDPFMFVQTHLDGLPEGEMKLLIQAFDVQDQTVLFFDCPLIEEAQILGWNLVLYECTSSARSAIDRANATISKLAPSRPVKASRPETTPEAMLELMQALKRSLSGPKGVS